MVCVRAAERPAPKREDDDADGEAPKRLPDDALFEPPKLDGLVETGLDDEEEIVPSVPDTRLTLSHGPDGLLLLLAEGAADPAGPLVAEPRTELEERPPNREAEEDEEEVPLDDVPAAGGAAPPPPNKDEPDDGAAPNNPGVWETGGIVVAGPLCPKMLGAVEDEEEDDTEEEEGVEEEAPENRPEALPEFPAKDDEEEGGAPVDPKRLPGAVAFEPAPLLPRKDDEDDEEEEAEDAQLPNSPPPEETADVGSPG